MFLRENDDRLDRPRKLSSAGIGPLRDHDVPLDVCDGFSSIQVLDFDVGVLRIDLSTSGGDCEEGCE